MIPNAAAITDTLASAGLPPSGIAWWWQQPRPQLFGFTPRLYLCAASQPYAAGEAVLRLARADVAELDEPAPGRPHDDRAPHQATEGTQVVL